MNMFERQPRRPRWSLVGLFLANAFMLACCMFWYSVVYTGTTLQSGKRNNLLKSSYIGSSKTSWKAKKQKLRFHRPLSIDSELGNREEIEWNVVEEYEGPSGRMDVDGGKAEQGELEENNEQLKRRHMGELNKSGQRDDSGSPKKSDKERAYAGRIRDEQPHPCSRFSAVLHIQSGDKGAAAGTLFFQYMINQILYAEMHNLIPFIYLDNVTHNVYDEDIHGAGTGLNWTVPSVLNVSLIFNRSQPEIGAYPGRPFQLGVPAETKLWFRGTGVWNHYLEPVSAYNPNHAACQKLPYVRLSYEHLNPGIQFYSPWAVRSWEYQYVPFYLRSMGMTNGSLHEWFAPQRLRAHEVIQKYYRFRPHLMHAAQELIPDGTNCLSVHIRHSDKAGLARKKIPTEDFLPFIDAYLSNGGEQIYLATDSSKVLQHVQNAWTHVKLIAQGGIVRSDKFKPVFRMSSHNRTNTEVLIDILSMARCQFMIHGYSAVSESSHYMNANLHNRSVDLEDPRHMNATMFGELVKRELASSKGVQAGLNS